MIYNVFSGTLNPTHSLTHSRKHRVLAASTNALRRARSTADERETPFAAGKV